jgi:hypothetical protein
MIDGGQAEDTLSISFVDGISCGLAAALLLFIIFGINISISQSSLGGAAGHGTVTKIPSELKYEPVDIFVEVHGPLSALETAVKGAKNSTSDHIVVNKEQGTILFIRELKKGFGDDLRGVKVVPGKISFNLEWSGAAPPSGVIHLFRSGTDTVVRFRCEQPRTHYTLISSFDALHAALGGDCNS